MEKKRAKAFFRDQIDNRLKVVCVFEPKITKEQMNKVVMEYLKDNEYDETDEDAPIHTEEDLEVATDMIVNGEVLDCCMDYYWIDYVDMYV